MSAAEQIALVPLSPRGSSFLGPATVVSVAPRAAEVRLPEGDVVRARIALAFPYHPVEGDTLLVIGQDGEHYVIGVIEGRGQVNMSLPGDVHLHAAGGSLTISADEGVNVRGPSLDVGVGRFTVIADAAVQKVASWYQRVREVLTVHAKESHTLVDDIALSRAKKHALVAEETASVNGKQILLG